MEKILLLLWQRSEKAISEMAREFGPRLYRTAMNILGIHEDAEETVSDTYMALWNEIPPQKPEPLAPYVYKTGRNIAYNRARSNSALKRCGYDVPLEELAGCIAGPDLWETLDARALGRSMDAFLWGESSQTRRIFLRRYWFGDSVAEIAKDLDMTENAVSVRLHRTREKLKDHLTKEGFL